VSLILRTATRLLLPLILLFSLFLMLRGHDEPGGGFVGGLVAGGAYGLYALAHGPGPARRILRIDPRLLIAIGLAAAVAAGILAILMGHAFLTGLWWEATLPLLGDVKVGSTLLFDIGVFLVVAGMVASVLFTLAEEGS
jgi:multicomponent Na+:H+ antiporter subunit B